VNKFCYGNFPELKTSEFDYHLPEELIAAVPPARRDSSRMLVLYRSSGKLEHSSISNLPQYLDPDDLLVLNNTRVIPARLLGYKATTGGQIELLLLHPCDEAHSWEWGSKWQALYRSSRPPRTGTQLILADNTVRATIISCLPGGRVIVELMPASSQENASSLLDILNKKGKMPVPPYVLRVRKQYDKQLQIDTFSEIDRERYQTIYASVPGAIAAPTAGLHFTEELFDKLKARNIYHTFVTLHVGAGTFQEVKVENIEEHQMEPERYIIGNQTVTMINSARTKNKRVVAVGTTTVRVLESVMLKFGQIKECSDWSSLFIYPGFKFKVVNTLLTNFHLPRSTLIMLVCAFVSDGVGDIKLGRELVLKAYNEAIKERYRFYSYGDCMLII